MARTFNLPDLGEGLAEAEIVDWRVAVGDDVALDQEIVEVETAKASVVIPSPFAGIVETLHGGPGDTIIVGEPLITFSGDGDAPAPATAESDTATDGRVPNLVGYGAAAEGSSRKRRRGSDSVPASAASADPTSKPRSKPPVRKLAKELGVDLSAVTPTGPDNTITRADVEAAAAGTPAPRPAPQRSEPAAGGTIPMRGIRRTIARHMETSHEIPSAAAWLEADATGLTSLRRSLKAQYPGERITALSILARLVVEALHEVPSLNARYGEDEITLLDEIHLGIAAATDRGLVVPVIHDAHAKTVRELSDEISRLADGARTNSLAPADLIGSTFTITNFGALGVDGGIPLINHPDVGILGMGSLKERAVVVDGAIVAQPTLSLSLSFDHRVADGAEASRFLTLVADWVAEPGLLLADQPPHW